VPIYRKKSSAIDAPLSTIQTRGGCGAVAGDPEYLTDREREVIEERAEEIHTIVTVINELDDVDGEDISEARESLQDHLHRVMYREYIPDEPPQLDGR